ncbi:tryptophan 7-halogenase [Gilvimarinus agarilyticus]|uniref:tryptophan halogenase family protein n=1 Tax=Gilvimarinus sp. 2_MG-2023 TaxID=3062666 RepID=UPI001C097E66|nr:tryptophan halogenase family protein [Gilvimarinus sp. 2_MG-2023]MBU2887416.1 tryptophan 7-halogenase [Gilvimarinus agarilyticus]MDO6572075.1 tryptophan 7-halogenase [Gilvimarinus sp. 2_MG-2023]
MNKDIVIVGGGTAGWLTAGILAAEFKSAATVSVTLIESPEVSTIGVGEGTWPTMRTTLKRIGISETDFLRQCSASFKQGSKFVGWHVGGLDDYYYHPFTLPTATGESDIHAVWRAHYAEQSFADVAGMQAQVSESFCAPKSMAMPEYAGALNYGYHLDAGKFAQLLQEHCTNNLNVRHIKDHVEQVENAENGDIAAVVTRQHGAITGDLFVDCTGSRSLLLGEHYQIPFIDCSHYSINDRAMAVQVPYANDQTPIASATIATAQEAGWTWDIGLTTRRGVGYVYSSAHSTEEQAKTQLWQYLENSVSADVLDQLTPRTLTISPGHRQKFWHHNCVAVGMSAGFIEPLEASALALVELSANMIRDEFPQSRDAMNIVSQRFNALFAYRWQRIIEFLKLHYVLSERRDTQYWRDVTAIESCPPSLQEFLLLWQDRPPSMRDFLHVEELFPAASYAFVLYGMGFETSPINQLRSSANIERGVAAVSEVEKKLDRHLSGLPSNREILTAILEHRLSKI